MKFLPCGLKGQLLLQGAHIFEAVPIRVFDHPADGGIGRRDRRCPLPHIYPLRPQALLGQIVGPVRTPLHFNREDHLAVHLLCLIADEHRHIRLDAVTHHICDLLDGLIRAVHTDNTPVIGDSNIYRAPRAVGKRNDFLFDVLYHDPFQFYGLTFLK